MVDILVFLSLPILAVGYVVYLLYDEYCHTKLIQTDLQRKIEELKLERARLESEK